MTFAELYHAHHNSNEEDIPFWIDLAERQGGPVLELGCGTGRVLARLARLGYSTFGFDLQFEMLKVFRKHLPGNLQPTPQVFQADMSSFHLASLFPLIMLPCNTLSSLSRAQRQRTLQNVSDHLTRGGRFSACIPNPSVLAQLPEIGDSEVEDLFPHPLDGEPVQVSSSWKRINNCFILLWHYDHLLPDGKVERLSRETRHDIQPIQAYRREIQDSGMAIESAYGDFSYLEYDKHSPYYIFVARLAENG